jgi:hypothetical protein
MQSLFPRIVVAMTMTSAAMSFPISSPAQSIWLDRRHDKTITLEILKPNFDGEDNTTLATSALFLSFRSPLSKKLHFVAELPFAHSGFEAINRGESGSTSVDESESTLGNPYFGLEIAGQSSPVFAEIGIRVPFAAEDKLGAVVTGFFTDFDRFEAFLPDLVPITGMLNYYHKEASGLAIRLRGGSSLLINHNKEKNEDATEWFLGYSAQAGYESERVSVLGGVTGRANISEGDLDFGERSIHQLGFNASVGLGNVRPGVHFRLPLDDDLKNSLDFVLGFNLGIQLK